MVISIDPNPMTVVIIKSGNLYRDTQLESHVKMEAWTEVMDI